MPDQVTQGEYDDYVLISALNQYNYCPLRCYWMFVEHEYADNDHTIEGTLGHAQFLGSCFYQWIWTLW